MSFDTLLTTVAIAGLLYLVPYIVAMQWEKGKIAAHKNEMQPLLDKLLKKVDKEDFTVIKREEKED